VPFPGKTAYIHGSGFILPKTQRSVYSCFGLLLASLKISHSQILKIFSGSHREEFIVAGRAVRLIFGFPVSQGRVNHWLAENRLAWGFICNRIFGRAWSWSGWWDFGLGMHSRFILSKNQASVHSCLAWPASYPLRQK